MKYGHHYVGMKKAKNGLRIKKGNKSNKGSSPEEKTKKGGKNAGKKTSGKKEKAGAGENQEREKQGGAQKANLQKELGRGTLRKKEKDLGKRVNKMSCSQKGAGPKKKKQQGPCQTTGGKKRTEFKNYSIQQTHTPRGERQLKKYQALSRKEGVGGDEGGGISPAGTSGKGKGWGGSKRQLDIEVKETGGDGITGTRMYETATDTLHREGREGREGTLKAKKSSQDKNRVY